MTDENNRNDEIDKKEDAENIEKEEFNFEDEQVMDLPMIPLRGLSVFPNMVLHSISEGRNRLTRWKKR